jgi:hypothetical protein
MKFIATLMGCAMLIAVGQPFSKAQAAEGLVLTVDRAFNAPFVGDTFHPRIIVSVKNESQRGYKAVVIDCTWLKDGKAQETKGNLILNLAAQQRASTAVWTTSMFDYDSVSCRLDTAY